MWIWSLCSLSEGPLAFFSSFNSRGVWVYVCYCFACCLSPTYLHQYYFFVVSCTFHHLRLLVHFITFPHQHIATYSILSLHIRATQRWKRQCFSDCISFLFPFLPFNYIWKTAINCLLNRWLALLTPVYSVQYSAGSLLHSVVLILPPRYWKPITLASILSVLLCISLWVFPLSWLHLNPLIYFWFVSSISWTLYVPPNTCPWRSSIFAIHPNI